MNLLFESKNRTDLKYSLHNENTFGFYDRSGHEFAEKVRNQLNSWFLNYPYEEQAELKSRFKKTFSSAFYELFIHELFRRQGFEITIHPSLMHSNKRPDFLLKKNECEFYLEAKEARNKSNIQEADDKRINQFYDSFNNIKSPNYFLYIKELKIKSNKQPSTKKIIRKIEKKINRCDPDIIEKEILQSGFNEKVSIYYEDEDIRIIVSLIPIDVNHRNLSENNPIGMYPMERVCIDSVKAIQESFSKKAKRYGQLNKPYLICINAIGIMGDPELEVQNALWGSLGFSWSNDSNNRNERMIRKGNGLFLGENGPKYKSVSGVLITKVMESNIHMAPHWFAKHPFSSEEINFEKFDLAFYSVQSGSIKKNEGKTIGDILEIDDSWINI